MPYDDSPTDPSVLGAGNDHVAPQKERLHVSLGKRTRSLSSPPQTPTKVTSGDTLSRQLATPPSTRSRNWLRFPATDSFLSADSQNRWLLQPSRQAPSSLGALSEEARFLFAKQERRRLAAIQSRDMIRRAFVKKESDMRILYTRLAELEAGKETSRGIISLMKREIEALRIRIGGPTIEEGRL